MGDIMGSDMIHVILDVIGEFASWAFSTSFIDCTLAGKHFVLSYGMTLISLSIVTIILDVILYGLRSTFSKGDDD